MKRYSQYFTAMEENKNGPYVEYDEAMRPVQIIRDMLADLGPGLAVVPSVRAAWDFLEDLDAHLELAPEPRDVVPPAAPVERLVELERAGVPHEVAYEQTLREVGDDGGDYVVTMTDRDGRKAYLTHTPGCREPWALDAANAIRYSKPAAERVISLWPKISGKTYAVEKL